MVETEFLMNIPFPTTFLQKTVDRSHVYQIRSSFVLNLLGLNLTQLSTLQTGCSQNSLKRMLQMHFGTCTKSTIEMESCT